MMSRPPVIRTRRLGANRLVGLVAPVLAVVAAGCGGTTALPGGAAKSHSRPGSAEQVSFLRKCAEGVGAGELGDAAGCQCTLTQLEAQTNARTFERAVAAWEDNTSGAAYRSTVAQTIA